MNIVVEDKAIIAKEDNDCIGLSSQTVRVRTTIHTKPNSVTLTQSNYIMGRNQHSNKLWGRWKQSALASMFRTSTGKIAFLHRNDKGRPYGGDVAISAVGAATRVPEFRAAVEDFGIRSYSDIYPALGVFADGNDTVEFSDLSMALIRLCQPRGHGLHRKRRDFGFLHTDDPRELVSRASRMPYRKDVARAIREKNLTQIDVISYAGTIDSSWAADFIRSLNGQEYAWGMEWVPHVSQFYDQGFISRDTYRKMVIDRSGMTDSIYIRDSIRMARQLLTPAESRRMFKGNDISAVHQILVDMTNAQKDQHLTKAIVYSEPIKEIDGMQIGDYTIALAKTGAEVKNWGQVQNHCIGSYAEDSYGRYVHAAVMQGDKMVANFQLSHGYDYQNITGLKMTQIYGYGNSTFAGAGAIHKHLVDNGNIVDSRVSGIPTPPRIVANDGGAIQAARLQHNNLVLR